MSHDTHTSPAGSPAEWNGEAFTRETPTEMESHDFSMNEDKPNGSEKSPAPNLFALYGGQALWFPVFALAAFGLLFIYSSSSVYAGQRYGDEYIFFRKQLIYFIPAIISGFAGLAIPLATIDRYVGRIFLGCLGCTLLTKVPHIGKKVYGASRWIALGGVQIQPSEFLKMGTVMFASYLMARSPRKVAHLWPVPLAFGALLAQPDFGSTMILVLGLTAMVFIHGIPKRIFIGGLALGLPLIGAVMVAEPYRVKRLVAFLDPFKEPLGSGFQVIQSFVAIANGGWLGKGLGGSQQKLFFLPEAHTDFILAVIAEEMGFVGILVIAFIYVLLFFAMVQLIKKIGSHRERLLATGIFAMFAGSAIVNMGVVAGLLPTKGLPLPFISAGGSSLMANFFMMGLLSQIHKNSLVAEMRHGKPLAGNSTTHLEYIPNLKVSTDV